MQVACAHGRFGTAAAAAAVEEPPSPFGTVHTRNTRHGSVQTSHCAAGKRKAQPQTDKAADKTTHLFARVDGAAAAEARRLIPAAPGIRARTGTTTPLRRMRLVKGGLQQDQDNTE
jgi:hypothetical protein